MKVDTKKYYDMYNGVKGSQQSFKDTDGDWVEPPLSSIDNTLHEKSKAADILSCHLEKAILFASNNKDIDTLSASIFLDLKYALSNYKDATKR